MIHANSDSRQRRRDQRINSASEFKDTETRESTVHANLTYDRSISQDSQIDAIEQERKEKKDIVDFLEELDVTLRVPTVQAKPEIMVKIDQTIAPTAKVEELRQALKENCLKEMSVTDLNCVLDLLDQVTETEVKKKMVQILGEEIYEKYATQIYMLKYYENPLFNR